MASKYPIGRSLLAVLLFILAYGIGLMPCLALQVFIINPLLFNPSLLNLLISSLLLLLNFVLFIFSELVVSSFFIRAFGLVSTDGVAKVSLQDSKFYRFVLFQALYNPVSMILYFLHIYTVKEWHLRLLGASIGQNVTLGGRIDDPSLFKVGDGSVIAGMCEVLTHSAEGDKLIFKKVKIGSKCTIGQGSIILPGAVMKDESVLGSMSLLPKSKVIPKGEVWGGVPAERIK
ncbi:hypothetical protein GF352_04090 [archaeon]|nr:hypothetical protein [archaeon]